jgi:hypothetical protein
MSAEWVSTYERERERKGEKRNHSPEKRENTKRRSPGYVQETKRGKREKFPKTLTHT